MFNSFCKLKFSCKVLHCPILKLVLANQVSHMSIHSPEMQGTVRVHNIMYFLFTGHAHAGNAWQWHVGHLNLKQNQSLSLLPP